MNKPEALVRFFLSLWVLVSLILKAQEVNAAKCVKSKIGRWSCSPCGWGTRCAFCHWCLGYCYNQEKSHRSLERTNKTTYGEVEVPYRQPYIEMFEDLVELINNDEISHIDVVELFKVTYFALREDCILCSNNTEIAKLRDETKRIHQKLKYIMKSENITLDDLDLGTRFAGSSKLYEKFKKTARKSTKKALKTTKEIPANLTAKVDYGSSIAIAANITTTTTTTTTTTIGNPTLEL